MAEEEERRALEQFYDLLKEDIKEHINEFDAKRSLFDFGLMISSLGIYVPGSGSFLMR